MSAAECATDSNSVLNAIRDRVTKGAPRNWRVSTLGECFKWGSGGTPSRTEATYFNGDIPWVVIGDLTDGVVTHTQLRITESGLANSSAKWVEPGSVLIAMYGSIGKLGIAGCRLATNQAIAFTNPHPVNAKYLYYYLRWQRPALARLGKGATQLNISQTVLKEFPFLLAPLHEQAIVVAEIEKQFSRLDQAVANLQRVKANLKRYKASVLKDAVDGRLVPTEADLASREGRSFEPGEQFLQPVLEARRSQRKGKFKAPAPHDGNDLAGLPAGWIWTSLDSLAWDSSYGTSAKCAYANTGPAVLRIPNVQNGTLDLNDLKFSPSDFMLDHSESISEGDLLVIRTNGSKSLIGRAALVLKQPANKISFASYLIRFRLVNESLLPSWVSVVWQTVRMRSWLESRAATSAGQHNISMTVLATAAIPFPPFAEQARIVAEIDRRLSLIRGVDAEVNANLIRAQALRQSVLGKTFSAGLKNG